MSELTPEERAKWRKEAESAKPQTLRLLDALDETERNWQLDADRMREAREVLARVEALCDNAQEFYTPSLRVRAVRVDALCAALRGPSDTEGQA